MRSSRDHAALAAVGLLLLGPLVYLLVRAIGGASRLVDRDVVGLGQSGDTYAALPWLVIATIAAVAALAGWFVSLRRTSGDDSLVAERDAELGALRRAYEKQRQWSQKLSSELNDLHRRDGPLGGGDDIGTLLLRVAIELLDAEKGLLLSARDADDDGKLDVVAAQGFDADPEASSLVQRFGREVIERDTIIRIEPEDTPEVGSGADGEIENAVAIPIYISDEFHGAVICANGEALAHQDEVLVALGDHAGAILENSELHGRLRGSYLATVKMLADALEVKDPFLRGHSEEVSGLTTAMARRLELNGERREQLLFGSLLHDIGKIGVSERILLKPGSAHRGGVRGGQAPSANRLPPGGAAAPAGGGRTRDPPSPRALRRRWLSHRAVGGANPAGGARDRDHRCLQRNGQRPALSGGRPGRSGPHGARTLRRHPIRSPPSSRCSSRSSTPESRRARRRRNRSLMPSTIPS